MLVRSVAVVALIMLGPPFPGLSAPAFAQSRGDGRIFGTVKDSSGQPVEGAQVKALKSGDKQPFTVKTNKKGDWSIAGMAGGTWNIDISRDGYETKSISVQVSEMERLPSITVALSKPQPKADPNAEIRTVLQQGDALFDQKQYADARKVYEDLLAKYPEAWQLELRIARSYSSENQPAEALAHLQKASAKQPDSVEIKLLVASQLIDLKKADEANALLASIDMTQVKDPVVFLNAGITLLNQGNASGAKGIFDQVVQHFPNDPEGYYYRARAYLAMNSFPEAKADLQKFVSMASADSAEVAEAKKILDQIK